MLLEGECLREKRQACDCVCANRIGTCVCSKVKFYVGITCDDATCLGIREISLAIRRVLFCFVSGFIALCH